MENGADIAGVQFSMINSMRTGNFIVDTIIAFMIPTLLQKILNFKFSGLFSWLDFIKRLRSYGTFTRSIVYEERLNTWGYRVGGTDERNNILQKALCLYVSHVQNEAKLDDANFALSDVGKTDYESDYDSDSESDSESPADQLMKYSIVTKPPEGIWVQVTPDIEFIHDCDDETEDEDGKKKAFQTTRSSYRLRCKTKDASAKINEFVKKAYDWYIEKVKETSCNDDLYMYVIRNFGSGKKGDDDGEGDSDGSGGGIKYRRYKLSQEKCFDSLFFPEKQPLLELFGHFQNKTSKYSIKGYPHKLGLLLHGPPGTGKTSLIKALATHMKRNIVSIPLSKITTNSELMDIVFGHTFEVDGTDVPVKLGFSKTIFVFEDIDCASKIVHRRESKSDSLANAAEYAEVIEEEKIDASMCVSIPSSERQDAGKPGNSGTPGGTLPKKLFELPDALNLSGILNVLDGIVDTPNRVVVMTTNHPEKLDPALIRPGRIDKIVELGYMTGECVLQLLKHYFQTEVIPVECQKRIFDLFDLKKIKRTPAHLEQMCVEHETIDALVRELEIGSIECVATRRSE